MSHIAKHLAEIHEQVTNACSRCNRAPESVSLIAISKTFPASDIATAYSYGQTIFGESKLQEAEPKIAELPADIEWHFIGGVQRNKVRKILPLFPVIHAIDSLRLANYTQAIAEELRLRPKVFLQVNIGKELTKGGFDVDTLHSEIQLLKNLPNLDIQGLMCIPPPSDQPEDSRPWFAALRTLRDKISELANLPLPCLSMGMSHDFEIAIEEGATHIRVGSAIFGKRAYRVDGELGHTPT